MIHYFLNAGSPEEPNWRRSNKKGWRITGNVAFETGSSEAHSLAYNGDIDSLRIVLDSQKDLVNAKDNNDWTPLHESVRRDDNLKVIQFLIERGADVNAVTKDGRTPVNLAKKKHGENHPIVRFLESIGAQDLGPEL